MSDDDREEIPGERMEEDTMKILLATDCHLGYEQSTKRLQENDSFITFEEILQIANEKEVDFILLGGDLFHDCKPPQKVILQCMELLKKYTLGDREIKIQFLSNPEIIFSHSSQKLVNYEDPNMNISMPIFSIHGNHDNPSFASTGSMDLLGASGLINYFGKWSDLTHVTVPPMVIKKGKTYVSIYGLSYINDQRLSRLLRDEKLTLLRPDTPTKPFNIMVLHQNRARHTENGYIDHYKLPDLLDLIFWGHEHECRVEPEEVINPDNTLKFNICQPGSSVATSLCEGEAVKKEIGLLKINKRDFQIQPIKLRTVRPFIFDSISLREMDIKPDFTRQRSEVICEFVDDYIENVLLAKAQLKLTGHPKQPTKPLIRLRIFYSEEAEIFDLMRVTRKYSERIANPRDMIIFRKEKCVVQNSRKKSEEFSRDDGDFNECFRTDDDDVNWNRTVQGQIQKFFERNDKKSQLTVLSVAGLNQALKQFVEAGDDDAFKDVVNHQLGKSFDYVKNFSIDDENAIIDQLKIFRDERNCGEGSGNEEKDVQRFLQSAARKTNKRPPKAREHIGNSSDSDIAEDVEEPIPQTTRGRGRGSRGGGRAAKATPARGRGGTRGRGKAGTSKTALDVSDSYFTPNANSSTKVTSAGSSAKDEGTFLSQFRAKPSTQSRKRNVFAEVSDSE